MGSVLWRMRLGEGCLGEKGLMKRLRLKGRSSRVKEGFVMFIMQLACTVYCPVACKASSARLFVCSSASQCCQA